MPDLPPLRLQPRDYNILEFVDAYDGVAVRHIKRKFFGKDARTRVYTRVQTLVAHTYLRSHNLPASSHAFITLGPHGIPVLADILHMPPEAFTLIRKPKTTQHPLHHFAICDFRLEVDLEVENRADVQLSAWLTDRTLHQDDAPLKIQVTHTLKDHDHTFTLIPDSAFTLTLSESGASQLFLLEMDMDQHRLTKLDTKMADYLRWAVQQEHAPAVLFVTGSDTRATHIAQKAHKAAASVKQHPSLFWITTRENVANGNPLSSPIWHHVGIEEHVPVLPTTQPEEHTIVSLK